jgi:hypothetical protein
MSDWLWWFRGIFTILSAALAAVLVLALLIGGVLWLIPE